MHSVHEIEKKYQIVGEREPKKSTKLLHLAGFVTKME
jgi:hypothetical protein